MNNISTTKQTERPGAQFSILFVMLFAVMPLFALAQDPVVSDFKKVPTPPSPNASALGKFGDIPVSPSTGIPSIQIPIYSYSETQKELNLEVALSYHAGGHKVEDMASNVGFGWALNAGGVIMRTVKGIPDDATYGYLNTPPLPMFNTINFDVNVTDPTTNPPVSQGVCIQNAPTSFLMIKQLAENSYDGESDLFNLSVAGINEKFFINKNKLPVFLTPNNLRVEPTYTPGPGGLYHTITGFTLTDSKGIKYFFDVQESMQTDNAVEPSVPAPPVYISSWYLSKILSADQKDTIRFTYEDTSLLSYEVGLTMQFKTQTVYNMQSSITTSQNIVHMYNAKRISKITLPDETVVDFLYTFNREDFTGDKALTLISISNGDYAKQFQLSYDYFVSDNCNSGSSCFPGWSANNWQKRLKLLAVQEVSVGHSIKPYSFEYNPTPLPFRSSKEQDWWGYYNGGATGALMSGTPTFAMLGYDRIPSLQHGKAWVLEKINYPTGGKTSFTYELNQGVSEGITKSIGGLRVQKKEDYDPITNTTYSTVYTYSNVDNTTSGKLLTIPSYTAYWNTMLLRDPNDFMQLGREIYYHESLNPTQTLSYFSGSPVIYTRVREEQIVSGVSNGYKIYEYAAGLSDQMHDAIYPFVQKQDLPWDRGLLLKTSVYNQTNTLLSSDENQYQTTYQNPSTSDSDTRNLVAGNYRWSNISAPSDYLFGVRYYYLIRGKTQLIKNIKKDYVNGGSPIENITEYTYENTYHLPTLIKVTNSRGETMEVRKYYPFNYNLSMFPRMNDLVQKNSIADPVSVETWVTKAGVNSVRSILINDYDIVNTNLIKKNKISVLESSDLIPESVIGVFSSTNMYRSTSIKENVKIEKFDTRGRGVEFKLTGNEVKSIIWGDNNEYPIASALNAGFDDIAFTSFEETEKGNWTYSGMPVSDADAPTGLKVYEVANGLSRTLNTTKSYTLCLWRNGSVTVNNASLVRTGVTVDTWTYSEYLISNKTSVSFSGTGKVDEVRLFPVGSQMTSYTYHGAKGISSQSDVNGSVTRYDYDTLGRLSRIQDENRNIINQTSYNYKASN
jgi:YD repeat-containing protein